MQINAAGRYMAQQLHLPFVDYELMSEGLKPRHYLIDGKHPADWFLLEALNTFMNLLDVHRRMPEQEQAKLLAMQHAASLPPWPEVGPAEPTFGWPFGW